MRAAVTLAVTLAAGLAAACGPEPPPTGPAVHDVAPPEAAVGERVVLHGVGLGETQGSAWVTVRGVPAPVAAWSSTRVEIDVPQVAAGETVIVVNGSASRTEPVAFTVLP